MSRSPSRAVVVAAVALVAGGGAAALAQAPGETGRVHSVTYPVSPIELPQRPLTFPVQRYEPKRPTATTTGNPG